MKRSTLLLIVLNAVTFFGIYLLTNKDENSPINPTIALVELLGDPRKITIGRGFPVNTSLTLAKEDDGWNILTPMKWKADEFATSKLTGRLRHIEARRLFSLEEIRIKEKVFPIMDWIAPPWQSRWNQSQEKSHSRSVPLLEMVENAMLCLIFMKVKK